jgi:hypothetical protein
MPSLENSHPTEIASIKDQNPHPVFAKDAEISVGEPSDRWIGTR